MPNPNHYTCDDCRHLHVGDPYYTFDADSCSWWEETPDGSTKLDHDCTEALCPECAGPFLEPDRANDPRRPPIDFYDERIHASLERKP